MRLTLVTDAWLPQVNGVTTTLSRCRDEILLASLEPFRT
jgi:hypothetical protein